VTEDHKDAARAAILRRRAFFVGSALTALTGCPQPSETPRKADPVVGVEPESASASLPAGSGVSTTSSSTPASKMPSLEIPQDAKGAALAHYQTLAKRVPAIHVDFDAASSALSGICDITDPKCDDRWLKVAKHIAAADEAHFDLAPRCPGTSKQAKAYEKRLAEHQAFIADRKKAIEGRINALLQDAAAQSKWKVHKASASVPRPCLDYACSDW
jgi:hypothetical protein